MWHDAYLMAAKDLRVEYRSKVTLNQVLPFALVVLILFAFAVEPDSGVLVKTAPGLFWITALFSAVMATQRTFAMENANGALDGLRSSGIDPAGVFLGKAAALAVQLSVLESVLFGGVVVFYGISLRGALVLLTASALATGGLACASVIYGSLAAGLRGRETLLPLLLLPVLSPVLLGAAKSWTAALQGGPGGALPWMELLGVFAVLYGGLGIILADPLLEAT